MRPVDDAGNEAMLHIVERKMVRLTHDVPTLRMERIMMAMQEHVVGVPRRVIFRGEISPIGYFCVFFKN